MSREKLQREIDVGGWVTRPLPELTRRGLNSRIAGSFRHAAPMAHRASVVAPHAHEIGRALGEHDGGGDAENSAPDDGGS